MDCILELDGIDSQIDRLKSELRTQIRIRARCSQKIDEIEIAIKKMGDERAKIQTGELGI